MDKLLAGLAKFGLDEELGKGLFADESSSAKRTEAGVSKEVVPAKEEDFLLLKTMKCPICDASFRALALKSGRAKRKEPDLDLRPRYECIDVNKYDVASCPKCGFTALHRFYAPMPSVQMKLIREGVCAKFATPPVKEVTQLETIDYDSAIERYKLALYTSIVKKAKNSEKAYTCLKIAWTIRGKMEELAVDKEKNKDALAACKADYDNFYKQAFDGFVKAMSSENYPMCGMDQSTVDLLIAAMAYNLGQYEYSSRFVSSLIVSRTAPGNIKNRAHDLKEKILEKLQK